MIDYGCIIPVAGLSSRMGDFKPLLKIGNITMIEHTINSVLDAGIDKCILVLGYKGKDIEKVIKHYDQNKVIYVYNEHYDNTDMMYSIKIGLQKLLEYNKKGSFIVPGDMPRISSSTFITIASCLNSESTFVAFPTYMGKMKHPPLVSKNCFNDMIHFDCDGGLRKALSKYADKTESIEINDYGCCLDADTMEEFLNVVKYQKTN